MKRVWILLILILFSGQAWATAQAPDRLSYRGEVLPLFSNPLEAYFGPSHPRPDKLLRASCSANWRGYVANWEIQRDQLYLIKLVEGTCGRDAKEIPLSKIFPGKSKPILASWYSGILVIPQGKQIKYVHMGYSTLYEKELHLKIQQGKVIGKSVKKNLLKP